uniref:Prolyl endopeptidase n=2 Tax=Rhabditophanes sp. KR3021 TaxID=114890 RepID=A0AC35U379_9BILA
MKLNLAICQDMNDLIIACLSASLFQKSSLGTLQRVLVIPNLRGGAEYGKAWHEGGMKLNKQNVFDDFIGAVEYLIKEKYTCAKKIAIREVMGNLFKLDFNVYYDSLGPYFIASIILMMKITEKVALTRNVMHKVIPNSATDYAILDSITKICGKFGDYVSETKARLQYRFIHCDASVCFKNFDKNSKLCIVVKIGDETEQYDSFAELKNIC